MLTEDGDIYKFDNSNGENNCWLNSVLQVLIHCVKLVQNEDYQYPDVETNAFINYLKNPSLYINSGKLCVTDKNIPIVGRLQLVSMKDLFTTIIHRNEWNNTEQQDSSEALSLILGSLIERGRDGPYNFCDYVYNVWVTCRRCNNTQYDRTTLPPADGMAPEDVEPQSDNIRQFREYWTELFGVEYPNVDQGVGDQ